MSYVCFVLIDIQRLILITSVSRLQDSTSWKDLAFHIESPVHELLGESYLQPVHMVAWKCSVVYDNLMEPNLQCSIKYGIYVTKF